MTVAADLRTLWQLLLAPIRGSTHVERLESFYRGQAAGYDDFRARLLPGRSELFGAMPVPAAGRWVDMGGGTGANLEHLGERLPQLAELFLVDLSPSLLEIARRRVADRGWSNVRICQADATTFQPQGADVDVVTFSYSLTMIPDWFAALEQAWQMLKPGGWIGVVDFYVSRKHAGRPLAQHGWMTRTFWPAWFALDNVFPDADHLPYLRSRFATHQLTEGVARIPYLPLGRVPYYCFVGRKLDELAACRSAIALASASALD